ncbi:Uma2 family endonuclease [Mucilaginibacter sp. KACC 22773]|uniref:Uma2 family endonuclease n=1 Tax=Mucilaginibacter sp. KACC 22773 TaxID=3025671 RepID=UPI0023658B48|nr:Uma2 family endonuclease [Mucilaginibacter sp. KACC 22773]WDF77249.1 Uma2 family endonuclease [Mucilaginibacter sp. KACC 22773]
MPIGAPYQYINGCLIDWPSRTVNHQLTLAAVATAFITYEDRVKNEGTYLMRPIEVILGNQNSFQPDFVYVAEERRDIIRDYIYGPPDLVVEVLWEKNAYYDLRPKKDTYEKYGVKEYVIIDPIAQNADLYVLRDGVYYLHQKTQKNEIVHSLILPGFAIELAKVFK